jgi:aminoglycoside N3'-acetyltransferase
LAYTKDDLVKSLKELGLRKGDVCVVRAALRKVGEVEGKRSAIIMDALLEVVGEEGTILTLTFTPAYRLPIDKNNPKYEYKLDSVPYSGGFAKECLSRENAVRSRHPTNSFCAIGRDAHFVLDEQDEKSSSFAPIGKVLEKNGNLLLIGCVESSPGFTTVHWAQWLLGLAKKSKERNKMGVYYFDDKEEKQLYVRGDTGGCSMGFHKFYKHYRDAGVLSEGLVGDAPSMLIDAKKAIEIETPLIEADPCFPFCDDPACKTCRIGWEFSRTSPISFWLRNPKLVLYTIKNRFKK